MYIQVLHDGVWELGRPIKMETSDDSNIDATATTTTTSATVTSTATTSTSAI